MKNQPAILNLLMAGLLACPLGCVTFGEKGGLPEDAASIAIPVLVNRTLEPGVEEPATAALLEAFQNDGRLRLESPGAADLVLSGTITSYRLTGQAYNREDRITSSYVETEVVFGLYDRNGERFHFQNRGFRNSGTYYLGIQPNARRQHDVYTRLSNSVIDAVMDDW